MKWEVIGLLQKEGSPSQASLPPHYLIVLFREMMELQKDLVPNRRIQADTKTRKMAIAEMASAMRSPINPLGERTNLVVEMASSHLSPWSLGWDIHLCESSMQLL